MEQIDIEYPLPAEYGQVLVGLVKVARRNGQMVVHYVWRERDKDDPFLFNIEMFDRVTHDCITVSGIRKILIDDLERLEYIKTINREGKPAVFLLRSAFPRADYERKSAVGKFLTRRMAKWRDTIIVISFVLSASLALLKFSEVLDSPVVIEVNPTPVVTPATTTTSSTVRATLLPAATPASAAVVTGTLPSP